MCACECGECDWTPGEGKAWRSRSLQAVRGHMLGGVETRALSGLLMAAEKVSYER